MSLLPRGPQVQDEAVLCFRQVHPKNLDRGRPNPLTFRPRPSEHGLMSITLSNKRDAASAYELYTRAKEAGGSGLQSAGVWAVTVAECHEAKLTVHEHPPDDAHGCINFQNCVDEADMKTRAAMLLAKAVQRKRIYPPEEVAAGQ